MDVSIIEISTSKLVANYPIILGGQNYKPLEQEYFDEAWRCAIDDDLVINKKRPEYRLELNRFNPVSAQ